MAVVARLLSGLPSGLETMHRAQRSTACSSRTDPPLRTSATLCVPQSEKEELPSWNYVAAQGPLDNTAGDFWSMIYENGYSSIVMLTKTCENRIHKCSEYFPRDDGECCPGQVTRGPTCLCSLPRLVDPAGDSYVFEDFTVDLLERQELPGCDSITTRRICVTPRKVWQPSLPGQHENC